MKILYLSTMCSMAEYERMFWKYGTSVSHAGQKFSQLMVRGFDENGCSVDVLSQRIIDGGADDRRRPDEEENGLRYTYLPRSANKKLNRLLTLCSAIFKIYKWGRKNPDGVVVCDIIAGELSLALCFVSKLCRVRTMALVTDVPNIRAGENRTGLRSLPYKLKAALIGTYDSYIFLTEQMNAVLNPKNKPYTVVEGIVDKRVLDEPNDFEKKHPEKVCIMAGLLEDIYGVGELLRSFEKLECHEARLRFYGKGSSVEDILAASERDNRISYCGELTNEQMVREEKKASLLINPRPSAGRWTSYSFPSKNMEYIASGTPMLAYVLPCIPEEYFPYSFYIEEGAGAQMEDKLAEIISMDREKLHAMGLSAQKWIVEEKNAARQMKKVVSMINSMK